MKKLPDKLRSVPKKRSDKSKTTARKETKRTPVKTDDRYRITLERITDGFVSLDKDWCYTYMNKAAGQVFNRDPEKMIGKHLRTQFPEGVGQPFQKAYEKAMREQKYIYLEAYYAPYDKWFENHIYPSPDGLSIYFRDISESRKVATALAESENHLRTILDSEPECIKLLNKKSELIEMNPAGLDMIEADNLEMVKGKSMLDIIDASDRESFKVLTKRVFQGESGELEFKINGLKGTDLWLHTNAVPLRDETGKIISLLGLTRNITERKENEKTIRVLRDRIDNAFRIAEMGIWEWDVKKDEVYWSDRLYELYDVDKGTPPKYEMVISRVHSDDRKFHDDLTATRIKTKDSTPFEYRLQRRDGSIRHMEVQIEVTSNEQGEAIKFSGTVLDITNRKEAEIALRLEEESYANLLKNINGAVYRCSNDNDWTVEFISEGCTQLTGYKPDELIESRLTTLGALMHPEDASTVWDKCQINLAAHKACSNEYRIYHRDGTIRWVWDQAQGIYSESGELLQIEGLLTDVTKQKLAEETVHQLNQNLELRVKERTAELAAANTELKEINDLFVGREARIIELKADLAKAMDKLKS